MSKTVEITDFSSPALDVYARLTENQLVSRADPANAMFIAESPLVIGRALDAGYEPVSVLMEARHGNGAGAEILARLGADVPVFTAPDSVLVNLTGFHLTRGMLCCMRRRALPPAEALCRDARRVAVLENVMNPTNIGAIFRSAAALGMDAVLLTEAGSDPLYRRAARVSMGTVTDPRLGRVEKLALCLGTEGDGLANDTIADCDYTVRIPMSHGVDSLNVAAASAVAFYQLGTLCRKTEEFL